MLRSLVPAQVPVEPLVSLIRDIATAGNEAVGVLPQPAPRPPLPVASSFAAARPAFGGGAGNPGVPVSPAANAGAAPVNLSQAAAGSQGRRRLRA